MHSLVYDVTSTLPEKKRIFCSSEMILQKIKINENRRKFSTVEIVYNEHEDQAEFARYNRFSL